jgi:hypothetical protein
MARYRLVFMERANAAGERSENPTEYLVPQLTDGVVMDAVFVERTEPLNQHVQDVADEDDSFLSIGTEVWDYEVAEGREQEFLDAVRNSEMVIDVQQIDDMEMIRT